METRQTVNQKVDQFRQNNYERKKRYAESVQELTNRSHQVELTGAEQNGIMKGAEYATTRLS